MSQSSLMNGGDGRYSYTKNSALQRNSASAVMDAVKKELMDNLDIEKLLSGSTTFVIADLGCSVGPNTFLAMETMIETVEHKYHDQGHDSKKLEFQVLFNDQTANDFNTLFASLPLPRNYFAAGVPGSFHGRLFPSSSVHIAYSAYGVQWLSKVPEELVVKGSPSWNAGRVHYTGASEAVVKAYADQFEADMEVFLRSRAEEIVAGGVIVILMPGVDDGIPQLGLDSLAPFFESILLDMVKEGVLEVEQVDSFNFRMIHPTLKHMRKVVEKNECFEILNMGLGEVRTSKGDEDGMSLLMQLRAALEGTFSDHFGNLIADQVFSRAMNHESMLTDLLHSFEAARQLWVVLKRNYY